MTTNYTFVSHVTPISPTSPNPSHNSLHPKQIYNQILIYNALDGLVSSMTIIEPSIVPSNDTSMSPRKRRRRSKNDDNRIELNRSEISEILSNININIHGDFDSVLADWRACDYKAGRRVVQFRRCVYQQDVDVFFEVVSQNQRNRNGIFVSCVWCEELKEFYVTSVDCIYLIECVTGIKFTQEEKNRVRRNLEIFKPITVGKNKKGDNLYRKLMRFDNPKPRNIKKDVKVFAWSSLKMAVEKIIKKYSAI
nr:10077_t:CDS:2 [Entrophospora candida]CAG8520179.1 7643_t:CDS:2 [Entrophospora candida]